MSKINGKPFIQSVIDSLTDELKSTLTSLINGSNQTPSIRSLINPASGITNSDKNKVQHIVLETWNKVYTGYLIYNNSYCVFISYQRNTQELTVLNINLTNNVYTVVREYLSIVELRFLLRDYIPGSIEVSDIIETTNIRNLSDEQIDSLKCGDLVAKVDNTGKHIYLVTYKKDGVGICLTYIDASVVETVSYDYTGSHWVYNSMDVTSITANELPVLPDDAGSKTYVLKSINGTLTWVEEE